MKTLKPIPVTVLTGFLGAGKTTLLNRILTENHGKRIAVIENEFGEIGVDNELVIGADEEIFEMNNGCICCTVRGDLIRILGQLLKRKDRLDHIIIETTGLANPAPVAQTFWVDDEMKEQYSLDAIVTLVDAKHIWQHIEDSAECQEQVAFADVILLNKIDLVALEDLDDLEKKIHSMNSHALIYRTVDAGIEMDKLLNVHAFNLDKKAELNPDFLVEELPFEWAGIYNLNEYEYRLKLSEGPDETIDILLLPIASLEKEVVDSIKKNAIVDYSQVALKRDNKDFLKVGHKPNTLVLNKAENIFRLRVDKPGHYVLFTQHMPEEFDMQVLQDDWLVKPIWSDEYAHSHTHDSAVTSVGIEVEAALDLVKLNKWLDHLLGAYGTDIFRMKGILNIKGDDNRFVFQGVHMLFEAKSDRQWLPEEKRRNQLIFIGKNLDRKMLVDGFNKCVSKTSIFF